MRVVLVGDSQAQGLARPLRALLGPQLVFVNAVSGRSTSQMGQDAVDDAQDANADLVIVASGGNDYMAESNPGGYRELVEQLTRDLMTIAGRVLWLGPATALPADVARRHNAAATIQASAVRAGGGTWLDSRPLTMSGHDREGVHFVSTAYERWARAALRPYLPARLGWLLGLGGVLAAAGGGAWAARRWRRR